MKPGVLISLLMMVGVGCATEPSEFVGLNSRFIPVSESPQHVTYKVGLVVSSLAETREAARRHCAPADAVQLSNKTGPLLGLGLIRIVEYECRAATAAKSAPTSLSPVSSGAAVSGGPGDSGATPIPRTVDR
jgi:hypothetical protein